MALSSTRSASKRARSHSVKRLGPGPSRSRPSRPSASWRQLAGPLLGLAREQLEHHVLGRHLPPARLGEAAVAEAAHGLGVGGQPADGLGQPRVVAQGAAAAVGTRAPRGRVPCSVRSIFDTFMIQSIPRSMAERALAHRPSVVELAQQVLLGHLHVGEEDLVEVGVVRVGELGQGPAHDARRAHVDDQHADAAVLGRLGVGAHVAQAEVGLVGARGPHLLPVHDEVAVAVLGPGASARPGRSRRWARSCRGTR